MTRADMNIPEPSALNLSPLLAILPRYEKD